MFEALGKRVGVESSVLRFPLEAASDLGGINPGFSEQEPDVVQVPALEPPRNPGRFTTSFTPLNGTLPYPYRRHQSEAKDRSLDMAALVSALVFFGLTAVVMWVVWRVPQAVGPSRWLPLFGRMIGLVFAFVNASLTVFLLSSYARESDPSNSGGSLMTLVVAILFALAAVLLAVGSVGPSSTSMRGAQFVGWGTMIVSLFLSGTLALLIPFAAVGAASFIWRRQMTTPEDAAVPLR